MAASLPPTVDSMEHSLPYLIGIGLTDSFVPHDGEDLLIGLLHPFAAESPQIGDGLLGIDADDPLLRRDPEITGRHQGRLDRRRGAGRDLHRAGAARPVADDAGHIANHVVDAQADLVGRAPQQPGDGRPGPHRRRTGRTQGRELGLVGLDIDGQQVALFPLRVVDYFHPTR